MATFAFFGKSIELPATMITPAAKSRDHTSWLHEKHKTVRLSSPIKALRVHTAGRAFRGREASNEAGAWLLIGDVIQSSGELASSRSLPVTNPKSMVAFTHVSEAYLESGTVLNIGIASAKFGGQGGQFQAEYVSGPPIRFIPIPGKRWHGSSGRA